MPNLKYNRLLVLSDTLKAGNQFEFPNKLNLITADDNSVGKSTVVKLIFWVFGCEPYFDSTWEAFDCKVILDFSIDTEDYKIHRYKDIIHFKDSNSDYQKYIKVTGDFSIMLAELFSFKAKLPKRNTEVLETPPPAFYFSPFYIDQKKSWSQAWENFDKLGQYSNWKKVIINYHIGLLTPEHFEIEEDIYKNKELKKTIGDELTKLKTATNVINNYIPKTNATTEIDEFEVMTEEIKIELQELSENQEKVLNKITIDESERTYLQQQAIISENIIKQLDADYTFAVENVHEDKLECPLCGVLHENSVINRASILADKQQAEEQLKDIFKSLNRLERGIQKTNNELEEIRISIQKINEKYISENKNDLNLNQVLDVYASNKIQNKIEKTIEGKIVEENNIDEENDEYKKEQKALLSKEDKENINNYFIDTFSSYISTLDAEGVNLSKIKKPTDHSKVSKEGGAAEGIRGILSYYLTIYLMVHKFGNEVVAPFVIDTPNQHEQSIKNYDNIVEILSNDLPIDSQLILCAMDNKHIEPFAKNAHVIRLDSKKILQEEMYLELKEKFKLK